MKVIKRDGRQVQFDATKIEMAVLKAILASGREITGAEREYASHVAAKIESAQYNEISVEQIQDLVEKSLMVGPYQDAAKAYIIYRNERTKVREMNSGLMRKVRRRIAAEAVENSNANLDENTFSGREKEASSDIQKQNALDCDMHPDVANAHKDGLIYQHDLDKYSLGEHNCLFVDFQRLFTHGFVTRNGDVRPPKRFSTACQQVAVAFQAQSQNQYGGVASVHIDRDLAPFVKLSFYEHYQTGLEYLELFDEEKAKQIRNDLCANFPSINDGCFDAYPHAKKYAADMLEREGNQSMQAMWHNLNTLESRPGSQLPFTSINLGRDISPEGRLVTKWAMNASISGVGKYHLTSIFPISIFSYKQGVNANPEDPNYDLKQLALKSLSRRIFPNFCNGDWSEAHEDPNDPDTTLATMGCVDGEEVIICRINQQPPQTIAFAALWNLMADTYTIKTQPGRSADYYIDVDNLEIWDTKNGFVKVLRIINNESDNWVRVSLTTGATLLCTSDHPFTTENRGTMHAIDLTSDDMIATRASMNDNSIVVASVYSVEPVDRTARSYDVETESGHFEVSGIYSHNCRTLIGYDRHGLGYTRVGRGNNNPITIILPKLGIEYGICLGKREKPDLEGFMTAFEDTLALVEQAHLDRFKIMKKQSPKAAPFMYKNGTIQDADKCEENVYNALKHNTFAIGYIGVSEMCMALFGQTHVQSLEAREFALNLVKRINEFAKDASERSNLNFSCYATPAEGLAHTALKTLRSQYGVIPGVTDREYLTNSHHCGVWEKVSIYEKIAIEAPFCKYPTGGCITYIEVPSTFMDNLKAIEDVIDYAFKEKDIPYLAINFPIDSCLDCGYQSEFNAECPMCGSENIQQLRRVTGYLSTDYRNFNNGKQAEVKDRVKHSNYMELEHE